MAFGESAKNTDLWSFSVTSFTAVIFIVSLRLMLYQRYYTYLNWLSLSIFSSFLYFAYIWYANYFGTTVSHTLVISFGSPHFYLTILLTVVMCYIVDVLIVGFETVVYTQPSEYLRAWAKDKWAGTQEGFEKLL